MTVVGLIQCHKEGCPLDSSGHCIMTRMEEGKRVLKTTMRFMIRGDKPVQLLIDAAHEHRSQSALIDGSCALTLSRGARRRAVS